MVYIRRVNEGEYGDIPIPTGYLAPNNSIPHIPKDFFDNKETLGTIISKRIVGNKYLMLIKFDSGLEEISFKVDKYVNHKVGDEIKIKMKTNESESMMDNVYFLSDALIMAFQDGDISIDEVELMKGYGPEESIIRKNNGHYLGGINIESVAFCMGYTTNNISRNVSTNVDDIMNLCLIYNNTKLTPIQIERIMSRFYRRIVRFGWTKVGDKAKKVSGSKTLLNIRLEKLKPKTK